MSTQVLALQLLIVRAETGNNEDWLDQIPFVAAVGGAALSLVGITLSASLALVAGGDVLLHVATNDGTGFLINGGAGGILSFAVPRLRMARLAAGDYALEIKASADGMTRVVSRGVVTIIEGVSI